MDGVSYQENLRGLISPLASGPQQPSGVLILPMCDHPKVGACRWTHRHSKLGRVASRRKPGHSLLSNTGGSRRPLSCLAVLFSFLLLFSPVYIYHFLSFLLPLSLSLLLFLFPDPVSLSFSLSLALIHFFFSSFRDPLSPSLSRFLHGSLSIVRLSAGDAGVGKS